MDLHNTPTHAPATRHDGWTDVRRAQFLDHLAGHGNVRAACSHVGLSAEAAYRLRRRDAVFARAWAAALVLGRVASADVLGDRAIEGVEEEVWYRGEVVGTRRRYDTRLLLAHLARLDRLVEDNPAAAEDAARFDELVARAAGLALPEELAAEDGVLPDSREACMECASAAAHLTWQCALEEDEADGLDEEELGEEELDAREALVDEGVALYRQARAEAGERWDSWRTVAFGVVDGLLSLPIAGAAAGEGGTPSTPSTSSAIDPVDLVHALAGPDAAPYCART